MKKLLAGIAGIVVLALAGCSGSNGKIVGTASPVTLGTEIPPTPSVSESPEPTASPTPDTGDLLLVEKAVPSCLANITICQSLTIQLRRLCDAGNTDTSTLPAAEQTEVLHAFGALCPDNVDPSTSPAPVVTQPPPPPVQPAETVSEANAVGKANEYLAISGFSRQSLIEQLVSFDQFSTADATYAVDKINPDWNAEAAKKAKEYLAVESFSHQGLVDQLTSFDGFTPAQSEYGVEQAGL